MRLLILWMGKTKSSAATLWTEDYLRHAGRFARIAGEEIDARRGEAALLKRAQGRRLVLMTPEGEHMNSPQFAAFLLRSFAHDTREMALAIGGAEGFGAAARAAAERSISLSPMTFGHELARVMLLEQIYRALALIHHHPYPR